MWPAEEHMARLTAEGEAVDYSRRLTVAQEQLAEYAAQKEEDAAGYLQQAQSLEKLLTSWLETNDNSPAGVQAAARDLCQKLAEEAGEAKSFAAQQKADVERAKRTSSQVRWPKYGKQRRNIVIYLRHAAACARPTLNNQYFPFIWCRLDRLHDASKQGQKTIPVVLLGQY